jgi:hypothetical protein
LDLIGVGRLKKKRFPYKVPRSVDDFFGVIRRFRVALDGREEEPWFRDTF